MRLLVVEDESKAADYLQQGLMESGDVVDVARNGASTCPTTPSCSTS